MCDGLFYIVEIQDILKGSIVWLFKNIKTADKPQTCCSFYENDTMTPVIPKSPVSEHLGHIPISVIICTWNFQP